MYGKSEKALGDQLSWRSATDFCLDWYGYFCFLKVFRISSFLSKGLVVCKNRKSLDLSYLFPVCLKTESKSPLRVLVPVSGPNSPLSFTDADLLGWELSLLLLYFCVCVCLCVCVSVLICMFSPRVRTNILAIRIRNVKSSHCVTLIMDRNHKRRCSASKLSVKIPVVYAFSFLYPSLFLCDKVLFLFNKIRWRPSCKKVTVCTFPFCVCKWCLITHDEPSNHFLIKINTKFLHPLNVLCFL